MRRQRVERKVSMHPAAVLQLEIRRSYARLIFRSGVSIASALMAGVPCSPDQHESWREKQMAQTATPVGVNHVVLNVRDIEESHRFWTEIVGLKQVGALRPRADMGPVPQMRFYS